MNSENEYSFSGNVWCFEGPTPWHFVTLPQKISKEIYFKYHDKKKNFGSIGVNVWIGKSKWKTSIFYDSKRKSFVLPLKAIIRTKEKISLDDKVNVRIEIII